MDAIENRVPQHNESHAACWVASFQPIGFKDLLKAWNWTPPKPGEVQDYLQSARLRTTINGQRFAYARRIDPQRLRAYARLVSKFRSSLSKTCWKEYMKYLAETPRLYPATMRHFRPTLDWALSEERFSQFLAVRPELNRLKKLAKEEARQVAQLMTH